MDKKLESTLTALLEVEAEAKTIVEKAESEAKDMREKTRGEVQKILDETKAQEQQEVQAALNALLSKKFLIAPEKRLNTGKSFFSKIMIRRLILLLSK
jgi:vacuolar-type H+-ATPase subunit E/Vma4